MARKDEAAALMARGLAAHQAGDVAGAAALYRQALDRAPRDADALHLLGVTEHQSGRHAAAAELIARAIGVKGNVAAFHANMGAVLLELGRTEEAVATLRRAVSLDGKHLEACHNLANALRLSGRLREAEEGWRKVLRSAPDFTPAHAQLGELLRAAGRHGEAEPHFRRVAAAAPDDPAPLNNLSILLREMGRVGEAIAYQKAALAKAPTDPAMLGNLAGALHEAGALEQAAGAYAEALRHAPRDPALLNNFGLVLQSLGRDADAVACFDGAVAADPAFADAHDNLGTMAMKAGRPAEAARHHRAALSHRPHGPRSWNNLGNALKAMGRREMAMACWRGAIVLAPVMAEAYANLGNGLRDGEDFAAALASHRRAAVLAPTLAAIHNNLGDAARLGAAPGWAEGRYRCALALDPAYPEAWSNLALAFQRNGDLDGAAVRFDRALVVNPELPGARFNRGLLRLERGALSDGWPDYAYRFASGEVGRARVPPMPAWRGEPLNGGELLVWREQGLGDELMFSSLLSALPTLGGPTLGSGAVVECDRRLVGLMARSLPGVRVRAETLDREGRETLASDAEARHVPMGSLARILRGRLADFPPRQGWLVPDPGLVPKWRERLDEVAPGTLRVGVAWRSLLVTAERAAAYLTLDDFAPILHLPGITFVDLQHGDHEAELSRVEGALGVSIHRWSDLDLKDDLEDVAALIANLDLVITPAVSVGELAGALGTPVWRLGGRDWTWAGTDVRPWFPTMRVVAKRAGEGVDGLMARVARELVALAPPDLLVAPPPPVGLETPDPRALVNAASAALGAGNGASAALRAERALAAEPGLVEAMTTLGAALRSSGDAAAAVSWQRRALAVRPTHVSAWANLSRAECAVGDFARADSAARRALALAPDRVAGLVNLAHAARHRGDGALAARALGRAAGLSPDDRAVRANRALTRLAVGDLAGGWDDYAHRSPLSRAAPEIATLTGRVVEVVAEQGLGDEILFATCLPDVMAVAAGTRFVCDRRLVGLMERGLPGLEVRAKGLPDAIGGKVVDVMAGALPGTFRRTLGAFPVEPIKLAPESGRVARWTRVLDGMGPGLNVGICWASGVGGAERASSRTRLADWRPLADLPGVRLINLRHDPGDGPGDGSMDGSVEGEIAAAEAAWGRRIHRWPGLDLRDDLEEVAALCAALDLVVTVPTAVGELAAAVGTPVWRLTARGDWTGLGTGVRPWFPSCRNVFWEAGVGETGAAAALSRIAAMARGLLMAG